MRQPSSLWRNGMSKERKTCQNWKKNLIFTAVILLAAALIGGFYMVRRADKPDKVAHLVYGTIERTQTDIDLREDADYTFQSNGYEIHLQVRDGSIAFVDSPCPDHVCEQFGQLREIYDWAACIPAQAMLTIEPVE